MFFSAEARQGKRINFDKCKNIRPYVIDSCVINMVKYEKIEWVDDQCKIKENKRK